jgi:uncharacterized protein
MAVSIVLVFAAGCAMQGGSKSDAKDQAFTSIPEPSLRYPLDPNEWHNWQSMAYRESEAQMQEDIDWAVDVVNQYWADHWSGYFSGEYEPPTVEGGYEGTNGPTCDGDPPEPMNAYYCKSEDYVAWDMKLMRTYYEDGKNDVFPYVVIAHEWGHAVANRLDPSYSAETPELQADCLAGLALYGAASDGTLELEDGDGNEMAKTYSLLGDDTPWADPTTHGDAVDRMTAFAAGRSGNIRACIPYTVAINSPAPREK